jgi:ubiquinone/menaquinone biosynthesis C-methylase UbiE
VSFDRVAPHYRWLETLVFGNQLQQARTAFVREIEPPHRVLIVGEGDGRFLAELLRIAAPRIDCVEASASMIALARKHLRDADVNFIQTDIRDLTLCQVHYDLIVSHFFFDCFAEVALAQIITTLANAATPGAQWLVADFCYPARGWHRWRARALIAAMYFFFRAATGIEAHRLVDYCPLLRAEDFRLTKERFSRHGEIRSQLWQRVIPHSAQEEGVTNERGASRSE